MLVKQTGNKLHIIEGTMTPIHSQLGYIEVSADKIQVDANGDYYKFYTLVGDVYTPDVDAITQDATDELIKEIEVAVQETLDNKAKELGYDSIHTAVTYADDATVAKFQQEGQALRAWRSACWDYCYTLLGNGVPMTVEEVLGGLPLYGT